MRFDFELYRLVMDKESLGGIDDAHKFLSKWVGNVSDGVDADKTPDYLKRDPKFLGYVYGSQHLGELIGTDKDLALEVLPHLSSYTYSLLKKELKRDPDILGYLIEKSNYVTFEEIVKNNPDDKEIQLRILKKSKRSFRFLSKKFQYDPEFLYVIIMNHPATPIMKLDDRQKEVVFTRLQSTVKEGIENGTFEPVVYHEYIKKYPEEHKELQDFLTKKLLNDNTTLEDLKNYPANLIRSTEEIEKIWSMILNKYNEEPFEDFVAYLPHDIVLNEFPLETKELIEDSVKEDVHNAYFISRGLFGLPFLEETVSSLLVKAIQNGTEIDIFELPLPLKNKQVSLSAINLDPGLIDYLPSPLNLDPGLINKALEKDSSLITHLSDKQLGVFEIAKKVVEINPTMMKRISDPKIKDRLESIHLTPNLELRSVKPSVDFYVDWLRRFMDKNHLVQITKDNLKKIQGETGVPIWDNLKTRLPKGQVTPQILNSLESKDDYRGLDDLIKKSTTTYQRWSGSQTIFKGKKNYIFLVSIEQDHLPKEVSEDTGLSVLKAPYTSHPFFKDHVTLGWVRYTVLDVDNIWIDELQTDIPKNLKGKGKSFIGNTATFLSIILKKFIKFARSRGYESMVMPDQALRNKIYQDSKAPKDPFDSAKKTHFRLKSIRDTDVTLDDKIFYKTNTKWNIEQGKVLVLGSSQVQK